MVLRNMLRHVPKHIEKWLHQLVEIPNIKPGEINLSIGSVARHRAKAGFAWLPAPLFFSFAGVFCRFLCSDMYEMLISVWKDWDFVGKKMLLHLFMPCNRSFGGV